MAYKGSIDQALYVRPLEGRAVMGPEVGATQPFYGSVLKRGAKIGPSAHFSSKSIETVERERKSFNSINSTTNYKLFGKWGGNPSNTYLGVRFLIDGETHYGWVRLTVATGAHGLSATITAYAYETEADKKILAGVPEGSNQPIRIINANGPSLGTLAAGTDGLSHWRTPQAPLH